MKTNNFKIFSSQRLFKKTNRSQIDVMASKKVSSFRNIIDKNANKLFFSLRKLKNRLEEKFLQGEKDEILEDINQNITERNKIQKSIKIMISQINKYINVKSQLGQIPNVDYSLIPSLEQSYKQFQTITQMEFQEQRIQSIKLLNIDYCNEQLQKKFSQFETQQKKLAGADMQKQKFEEFKNENYNTFVNIMDNIRKINQKLAQELKKNENHIIIVNQIIHSHHHQQHHLLILNIYHLYHLTFLDFFMIILQLFMLIFNDKLQKLILFNLLSSAKFFYDTQQGVSALGLGKGA